MPSTQKLPLASLFLAFTASAFLFSPAAAQQEQLRPHSMYEPPAASAAASLAASAQGIPQELLTPGEKSNWQTTGLYAEAVAYAHLLEQRSKEIRVLNIGTTPEGRTMIAVVASKDRAFTPEAAHKTGKAIIYIQSGIHPGEIEGKDTALMLLRDMTVGNKPHQKAWLDKAIFVVVPVFNVDGHEHRNPFNRAMQNGPAVTGTRPTAQYINLNRDYIKADAPEMRASLNLYNTWLPDFMFDNHVTDGADYQYDVTYDIAHHLDIGAASAAWVNDRFIPQLNERMTKGGHLISPYGALQTNPANGKREFFVEVFSPRYSHLYSAARNRPCLLVETHSLKEGKTRAWSNYDIMMHSIDVVTEDPQALQQAVRASDAADMALAGKRDSNLFLNGKTSEGGHPIPYYSLKADKVTSPITGKPVNHFTAEKDDFETITHDGVDTTAAAPVPTGFLIPLAFKNIADVLLLHGIRVEQTKQDRTEPFETWRFTDVKKQPFPFEGRTFTDYTLQPVKETLTIPAGSFYVPLAQPEARLIMSMLHPAAPDALVRWGFMDTIFERSGRIGAGDYLSVPIAQKLASERPDLYKEFQAKLAAEPAFAADSQARLTWWLSRSSYQPPYQNRYPIVEVW